MSGRSETEEVGRETQEALDLLKQSETLHDDEPDNGNTSSSPANGISKPLTREDKEIIKEYFRQHGVRAVCRTLWNQIVSAAFRHMAKPLYKLSSLDEEDNHPKTLEAVELNNRAQDTALRKRIANVSIAFVFIQLICSNFFFAVYLIGLHDKQCANQGIMIAWMSSSVVEIIAILGIVASSLFPKSDEKGYSKTNLKKKVKEQIVNEETVPDQPQQEL